MSESTSQDKTEKASSQKIKKARQEGQIPRAKEFTAAIIFLATLVFFQTQLDSIWESLSGMFIYNMTLTRELLDNPKHMLIQLDQTLEEE